LPGKTSMLLEEDNFILGIDESWSDDHTLGIRGWILYKDNQIAKSVNICIDDTCAPINYGHPRPDVFEKYPQYNQMNCGFAAQIPRFAKHPINVRIETQTETIVKHLILEGSHPQQPVGFMDNADLLFVEFVHQVNSNHLKVLEIGSRIVSPGSSSKRSLFPNAASYTGFDYYPDDNTDVVGDAHQLTQYFGGQQFDAIFSISVFEHLAMPWVVAAEISKLLRVGGITFHSTHNAWPIHEYPWDFWRFSDQALRLLFSPPLGFDGIKAGYFEPLRMHLDHLKPGHELFPTIAAFGGVAILAEKVADFDRDRFSWNATVEEILGKESHYPQKQ
jgi:SAM-dependent methyltransferase